MIAYNNIHGISLISTTNHIYSYIHTYIYMSYHTYTCLYILYKLHSVLYTIVVMFNLIKSIKTWSVFIDTAYNNIPGGISLISTTNPIYIHTYIYICGIRHFRRKHFRRMHFRRRNIGQMEHWSNGTLVERNIGRTNIRLTEHSSNLT